MIMSLMESAYRLHPKIRFCGDPPDAFMDLSENLLLYTLAILRDEPVEPVKAPEEAWSKFLVVLSPHGIIPLLYWKLLRLPEAVRPPQATFERMHHAFMRHGAKALRETRQIRNIVTAFSKEGVRILFLKGPALAMTVYPDPATRPGSDLDVLVHPEDMAHARRIFQRIGYVSRIEKFGTDIEALYHHEEFSLKEYARYSSPVELHWKLHHISALHQETTIEELFARAVTVNTPEFSFEALHPVDALIHRALNNAFIHDHDLRLTWMYDILLIARSLGEPEEWLLLQKECVRWRARWAVELALVMAQSWYNLHIPDGFDNVAAWAGPAQEERQAWSGIVNRRSNLQQLIGTRIPRGASSREKLWLIFRLLFPDRVLVSGTQDRIRIKAYVDRWIRWINELNS